MRMWFCVCVCLVCCSLLIKCTKPDSQTTPYLNLTYLSVLGTRFVGMLGAPRRCLNISPRHSIPKPPLSLSLWPQPPHHIVTISFIFILSHLIPTPISAIHTRVGIQIPPQPKTEPPSPKHSIF
ncbi:hypothetical protein F5X98DRAFT_345333 [Xylaria grammica]|nr:hypothetical protein F5X98DRAFT_345333 [Xylaria grammica]